VDKGMSILVGTRGSQLALIQAQEVVGLLQSFPPQEDFRIKKIKATGDKVTDTPISSLEGKGIFVKELEKVLLTEEIDLAVHSLKDLPTALPQGLVIGAILKRSDPRDALITKSGASLGKLPQNALIGTSSPRRKVQLLHIRPDFQIIDLRGNLDTRLKKLESTNLDAIVVAACGLKRMGWEHLITEVFPCEFFLPAVGQGAIGIEIREGDERVLSLVRQLNDADSEKCILAERTLLGQLGGGCRLPMGALGQIKEYKLILDAMVADVDRKIFIRGQIEGGREEAEELGISLAQHLKEGLEKAMKGKRCLVR
jgi:hydroxymethylbilane synthase